jgi:hypothetical protein
MSFSLSLFLRLKICALLDIYIGDSIFSKYNTPFSEKAKRRSRMNMGSGIFDIFSDLNVLKVTNLLSL